MNNKILPIAFKLMLVLAIYLGWVGNVTAQGKTLDFLGEVQDDGSGYLDFVQMGCWQCHGFQGNGGEDGPRLAPNPLPVEAFMNLVRRPANVMPAYSLNILSDEKLRRIYGYLQSVPTGPDVSDIPLLSKE